jgi:hypothetical protein
MPDPHLRPRKRPSQRRVSLRDACMMLGFAVDQMSSTYDVTFQHFFCRQVHSVARCPHCRLLCDSNGSVFLVCAR